MMHGNSEVNIRAVNCAEKIRKKSYMTLELNDGDRLYKVIEARTFAGSRKKFISKIDKDNKITVLTYTFNDEDINDDGTVNNRSMQLLIKEINDEAFKYVISINYKIYPGFKILYEKDYSDKSLEEAIEQLNMECQIVTDAPIKKIIENIKRKNGDKI